MRRGSILRNAKPLSMTGIAKRRGFMPSTKTKARACSPASGSRIVLRSFKDVVQDYIARYRDRANNELASFEMLNSLEEAIERAARAEVEGGKKHDHQWRIPEAVLARAGKELLAKRAQISKCTGFDSLIELVETTAGSIRGFGELAIYDTAVRIGARLGMEPEFVYLHRGTRKGAKALGLASGGKYLKLSELPAEFTKLRPHEIEDCLCIYASELSRLKRLSHGARRETEGFL